MRFPTLDRARPLFSPQLFSAGRKSIYRWRNFSGAVQPSLAASRDKASNVSPPIARKLAAPRSPRSRDSVEFLRREACRGAQNENEQRGELFVTMKQKRAARRVNGLSVSRFHLLRVFLFRAGAPPLGVALAVHRARMNRDRMSTRSFRNVLCQASDSSISCLIIIIWKG